MMLEDRIISDYKIMLGKPVIRDTRITVELILRKLSQGASNEILREMYPSISDKDIQACLLYAADTIANEEHLEFSK